MTLEEFSHEIPNFITLDKSKQVEFFAYYLIHIAGRESVTPKEISECFDNLNIGSYSNIPTLMSNRSKRGKGKRYIKSSNEYVLERTVTNELKQCLKPVLAKHNVAQRLRKLEPRVQTSQEKDFLSEAIDCFEVGARRASITMVWILTVNHLYQYILTKKLTEFNSKLANDNDKRIRINSISSIDDFSEIPEGKLIELCRASRVISNDVRKILEEKLGTRNSAAHPSGISISDLKAQEFIVDLIDNVVLKYNV